MSLKFQLTSKAQPNATVKTQLTVVGNETGGTTTIDVTQLEYNKFNDFYKGLEQFREPKEMEAEQYEKGKEVYDSMKDEYISIGHESFLDAIIAEKLYDEDSLDTLKNMENVKK